MRPATRENLKGMLDEIKEIIGSTGKVYARYMITRDDRNTESYFPTNLDCAAAELFLDEDDRMGTNMCCEAVKPMDEDGKATPVSEEYSKDERQRCIEYANRINKMIWYLRAYCHEYARSSKSPVSRETMCNVHSSCEFTISELKGIKWVELGEGDSQ